MQVKGEDSVLCAQHITARKKLSRRENRQKNRAGQPNEKGLPHAGPDAASYGRR